MKLYRTTHGTLLERDGLFYALPDTSMSDVFRHEQPQALLTQLSATATKVAAPRAESLLAPLDVQEVWAAGVTYYRSRDARMEEAKSAGGGDCYARVYEAERPELFMKATPRRVVRPGGAVAIRKDSTWDVPEPELTLAVNKFGRIFGYTIGNDMSSRSIEGANPLYLPQAKVYDRCASLGPCLYLCSAALAPETSIVLKILREGHPGFEGSTALKNMKRTPEELVDFLFREQTFPDGVYLMTGTGIVPPSDFTLRQGDRIEISIEPLGTLSNVVG